MFFFLRFKFDIRVLGFVIGVVFFERMVYYGIVFNFIFYFIIKFYEGSVDVVINVWVWGGVIWFFFLLGGFIVDLFLG